MLSINRYLKAIILFALSVFLTLKLIDGSLFYYINRRFMWLTVVGAVTFLLLAAAVYLSASQGGHDHDHEHDHHHDHGHQHAQGFGPLLIICIPLFLGFIFPAQPLDSSVIQNKGISLAAPVITRAGEQLSLEQPADSRTILDWIRAFNYSEDPSEFDGQPASVIGFVYHDERLSDGQFMVGRIAVTCCVADAFAIGMVVEWPDAAQMADNAWVHVEGTVQAAQVGEWQLPLIVADEVSPTDPPPEPYVYP